MRFILKKAKKRLTVKRLQILKNILERKAIPKICCRCGGIENLYYSLNHEGMVCRSCFTKEELAINNLISEIAKQK